MNNEIKKYYEFVESRAKDPQEILDSLTIGKVNLIHISMGISGEMKEILLAESPKNMIEENGDFLFYMFMFFIMIGGIPTIEVIQESQSIVGKGDSDSVQHDLLKCSYQFTDSIKKITMYNSHLKSVDEDEIENLSEEDKKEMFEAALEDLRPFAIEILKLMMFLAIGLGLDFDQMLELNKLKLRKRYPDGYSDKDANERKDKS